MNRFWIGMTMVAGMALVGCGAMDGGGDDETSDLVPAPVVIIAGGCDSDHDGYRAPSCGGNDCNDTDASVHPGFISTVLDDTCHDDVDNDCDGVVNDEDECRDAGCSFPTCHGL